MYYLLLVVHIQQNLSVVSSMKLYLCRSEKKSSTNELYHYNRYKIANEIL